MGPKTKAGTIHLDGNMKTDHGMSRRQPAMSNASYGVFKSVVRVHCLTSFSNLEADVVETFSVSGSPPPLSSNLAQSDTCVAVLLCLRDKCREGLNLLRVGIWHYSALSLVYKVVRFFSSCKPSVTHICNTSRSSAVELQCPGPILRSVLLKAYTWRVNCGRVETCRCKLSTPR